MIKNQKTIVGYKKAGEHPLDLLKKIKKQYPALADKKIAYAGRLDPLAEGVVLFVVGEELKNFESYLKLDKEYEAKIVFGFSTDTYDILGISKKGEEKKPDVSEVIKTLERFEGDFEFTFPPFSGYKIKKKPLFWWALQNRLSEVKMPQKKVQIYSIEMLESGFIKKEKLERDILKKIKAVKGNFRQDEITKNWEKIFEEEKRKEFLFLKARIACSSGCYIRSIADEIGKETKLGAALLHLKRNKVGNYSPDN